MMTLQQYLDNRLANTSDESIHLLTGGKPELFAYIQLMWTNQFIEGSEV